ncbi:glutathione S-transferase [Novosphingobium sp. 9U]|uniref:glutathione S-transferase n=1 Tax=Novosphingobium sp. 9U TaxID=2653158 RepID=UPI0012F31028|nr:glutathione S-transferase [Novosphingobium sp. 9U]VWX47164.1 Glutathione S-transferase [Novosphingobium sp. 9U]
MTAVPEPILYSFRRCPYAMRARLALAVSGTRCELREVKLIAKPQAMLDASPKGTVPVVVLGDGGVIDQSLDIMRWALARSDPEGWLDRDDVDLIATNDGPFKRDLDGYKYPERHDGDAMAYRAAGLDFLRYLDAKLASSRYLAGSERGLADAAIMPFVRQFAAVDTEWFAVQTVPHVQAWLKGYLASELFVSTMIRPQPWRPGDPAIFFP